MMSMRRKDRQVTEKEEILQIMQNCDVVRLGIKDEDSYPYIVPLNFGMEDVEGQVVLYLHSALEGHKLDLLRKDSYVSFEMDRNHVLYSDQERGVLHHEFSVCHGQGEHPVCFRFREKNARINRPDGSLPSRTFCL